MEAKLGDKLRLYDTKDYWNDVEIIQRWSDLLNGDTLWVTKYELDEILDNLKSLNINTLMIQSCKNKFVVKVDELTVRKFKEAYIS